MSYFKISLLTPQITNGKMQYLESTISEFFNQSVEFNSKLTKNVFKNSNIYSFCYTFDEQFEVHKNAQKQLTFSMTKYIFINDEWLLNPFASALHIGTQLLLEDKDHNEHFFTIKNIAFSLGLTNITFNITCQDSFSYQTITQNEGYTINNDPSSEDFIGARNIDYWVKEHIAHDCYIGYDYLSLEQGLYLDDNNNVIVYNYGDNMVNVQKIIKEPYSPSEHSEYFETFPFAISGSNASAALIALGEEIGLMLNVYEKRIPNTNQFNRYYWFEPTKNEHLTGLVYSPYRDVQSFDFSFGGESLVTVLNVEAQTNSEDELVTLIPTLPTFFMNVIETSEVWDNSYYSPNFFSSLCQNKALVITRDLQNDFQVKEVTFSAGQIIFHIQATVPIGYTYVSFEWNNEQSYIMIDDLYLNPKNSVWSFYKQNTTTNENDEIETSYELIGTKENPFTNSLWNQSNEFEIRINSNGVSESTSINNYKIYLNFYRDVTEEELEFANIADKCPWLENKIIDFSYFYNQKIINRQEYQALISLINNDLRIANGKLLLYSNEYNQALKHKIEKLSDITNDLDSIGAAFQADVVDTYAKDGKIDDITYFNNSYMTVFGSKYDTSNKIALLDYENILTQYGNKYFSSRQRFLKNMYKFREYFNSAMCWGDENAAITDYTISLSPVDDSPYFQFKDNSFYLITDSMKSLPPVIYDKNYVEYTEPLVTTLEDRELYVPSIKTGDFIYVSNTDYDPKQTYYRPAYKFEEEVTIDGYILYKKEIKNKIKVEDENGNITYNYTYYYYYVPIDAVQSVSKITEKTITVNESILGTLVYLPVTLSEMASEYIYYKKDQYYYHTNTKYWAIDMWLTSDRIDDLFNILSNDIFIYNENINLDLDDDEHIEDRWVSNYYKSLFPLETIYYYGPKFINVNGSYQRVNSKDQTQSQYDESPDGEDPSTYSCYQPFSIVVYNNENKFFRRKKRGSKNGWNLTSDIKFYFNGDRSYTDSREIIPTDGTYLYYSKVNNGLNVFNEINADGINTKYLYNYYDIVGLTYANIIDLNKGDDSSYQLFDYDRASLCYKDSYLTVKHSNDIVSKSNTYRLLELDEYTVKSGQEANLISMLSDKFSKIIYYPLYDASEELNLVKYDGMTVLQALKQYFGVSSVAEVSINNNKYFRILERKYLVLKEEPYDWEPISFAEDYSDRFSLNSQVVYDKTTDSKVQFTSFNDLTNGFYIAATEASDFEPATILDDSIIYYKKNEDDTYTRLYTEAQLKSSNSFYYSNRTINKQTLLKSSTTEFVCEMVASDDEEKSEIITLNWDWTADENSSMILETVIDDKTYKTQYQITKEVKDPLSNLTKGAFWYKYHSYVEWPTIFEQAAIIETELTIYWTQALNASKYCEFFIPDNWQPTESGNTNYFKDNLYNFNSANEVITLLDTYVPLVEPYKQQGQNILPKYDLRYRKRNEVGMNADTISNIEPIHQAFEEINESMSNWIAEENGTTTYYNYIGGGTKWNNLLSRLKSTYIEYNRFSGLYVMTYDILKNYYVSRSSINYENALEQHNSIWKQIYTNYQGLLLEGTYSNENATTAQELYTLASYYMKDITQPEKGYNITVIDMSNLEGYIGQELKIGSSIQINVNEYYDDYDDVANAISQQLFITDISYKLRQDNDIQLTVNAIKYQDKLIQRLAKLIK